MNDNSTLTPERMAFGVLLNELGHRIGNAREAALVADKLLSDDDYEHPEGTSWLLTVLVDEAMKTNAAYEELRDLIRSGAVSA